MPGNSATSTWYRGNYLSLHPKEVLSFLSWADLETMLPHKGAKQISLLPQGCSFLPLFVLAREFMQLLVPVGNAICQKMRLFSGRPQNRPDPICSVVAQVLDNGWKQTAWGGDERLSPSVVSLCQFDEAGCETVLCAYKTGKYRK